MAAPNEPVSLSVEQARELHGKLGAMRHDVNNELSKIAAAIELIRRRPESAERMWPGLAEQPRKISEVVTRFANELETALRVTRP